MTKREHEKAIFEEFLRVIPDFSGEGIAKWMQPADEREFPDIVCESQSGCSVGVELGEWLNESQIRTAKGMERIQESILAAVGTQGSNSTNNIFYIWLLPKAKARVKPADTTSFREQLFQYIETVDQHWPSERFWQSPQGHWARNVELARYPVLQKYLSGIHFFPSDWYKGWPPAGRRVSRRWPADQNWILFPGRGGAFSEDTMLLPLFEILSEKIEHYGGSGTGFDHLSLVVYYNSALIYNSPVETPHLEFADVVQAAREFIGDDRDPFTSIFLFIAVDEGTVLKIV